MSLNCSQTSRSRSLKGRNLRRLAPMRKVTNQVPCNFLLVSFLRVLEGFVYAPGSNSTVAYSKSGLAANEQNAQCFLIKVKRRRKFFPISKTGTRPNMAEGLAAHHKQASGKRTKLFITLTGNRAMKTDSPHTRLGGTPSPLQPGSKGPSRQRGERGAQRSLDLASTADLHLHRRRLPQMRHS